MRLLKNLLSFVAKHFMHVRRSRDGDGRTGDSSGREEVADATSVRTYSASGDPFEDHIEFHLGGRSGIPGGFRDPRE